MYNNERCTLISLFIKTAQIKYFFFKSRLKKNTKADYFPLLYYLLFINLK